MATTRPETRRIQRAACLALVAAALQTPLAAAAPEHAAATALLKQFCINCHAGEAAEGNINLERMTADLERMTADLEERSATSFAAAFKSWQKVAAMLEQGKMPPADAPQPSGDERRRLVALLGGELQRAIRRHAGDPGPLVLRRLTSAEYAYTVQDLTGLELNLERDFVSDAVGGEGFTNVGNVQFMQDAALERYLEAAKKVAAHTVIGAGPLDFFRDPGQTGLELSAIHRIQEIYRRHGFRTAAGEGGKPFGLDRYPKAFYAAWRYEHRRALGQPAATLAELAADEGLDARFATYIESVLNRASPSFPTSEIIARWRKLPTPNGRDDETAEKVRAACDDLYEFLRDWQTRLAGTVTKKEEAAVLSAESLQVATTHAFEAEIDWRETPGTVRVTVSVAAADFRPISDAVVIWKNPRIRFRSPGMRRGEPVPLRGALTDESVKQLAMGRHPAGGTIGADDFVITGAGSRRLELRVPEGASRAELFVDAQLDLKHGADGVVRCSISEDDAVSQGQPVSAILADNEGAAVKTWKQGVLEFARLLPQISHREPAPSDRDPIPPPFDTSYNVPERDHFHYKVKYFRDDRFLSENILDDATRRRLDEAWADLLGSFEYHDIFLRFVAGKFKLDLAGRGIADLDAESIDRLPNEPRQHVRRLWDEHQAVQRSLAAAQPDHLEDAFRFASRAWRRPLDKSDRERLLSFYTELFNNESLNTVQRNDSQSHPQAIRALVARILVAPEFLYRAERPAEQAEVAQLSDWELAARLSYFLWSSLPDEELRQAAAAGRLREPQQLAQQARRMLRDPKARRLSTEFFGQWFGFYQFDRYRGVDPDRFPEFNDALKTSLYEEAISLFDYIVRQDRPVNDILFADYTFLNRGLADHYALDVPASDEALARFDNVDRLHRGGLLGLGAVLTVTSAPLRTSPVKRGDWILRRVLGTPVPPPPADAGSIPADDVLADGKTVRQRLDAHRRNPACINCHSRIDPLGFGLENYDSLGRWRDKYRDAEPIDASGTLADGTPLAGPEGLRSYLKTQQRQFHRTLSTRLVGYVLGRGESIADQQLIENLVEACRGGEGRFADLVVKIVASPQFQSIRSRDK